MRCPNTECPYLVRHGRAASYRANTVTCSDCDAVLVTDDAMPATSVAATSMLTAVPPTRPVQAALIGAVAVSVLVAVFGPLLSRLPLPYVDFDFFSIEGITGMSLGSINLEPWLTAMVLVEVVALLVPRWRRLRHGDPAGRATLTRAATVLGLVLAVAMAWAHTSWLTGLELVDSVAPSLRERGPFIVTVMSIVAGSCLLRLAVGVVARFGVGNGFGIVLVGGAIDELQRGLRGRWADVVDGATPGPQLGFALALMAAMAIAAWLLVRVTNDDSADRVFVVRPSAGLIPAALGVGLVRFASSITGQDRIDGTYIVAAVVVVVVLVPVFARLFSSPLRAGTIGARLDGRASPSAADLQRASAATRRALPSTFVLNLVLLLTFAFGVPGASIALIAIVIKDLVVELRARREQGELVAVWPLYRFDLVAPTLAALDDAGIVAALRGAHQRALDHFFAPFSPAELLVPAADIERATTIVADVVARALATDAVDAVDAAVPVEHVATA